MDAAGVEVIAPNLKRRLSGVTATVIRLVPVQARSIGIATCGPGLPEGLPHLSARQVLTLPRDRLRVWHARRNTEMLAGLVLRHVLRRRLALLFTSAAQRSHSGYTRWLVSRMDGLVATSSMAASYLERPARVIEHGVDLEAFSPATDRAALRARLGLPPGLWAGCFGRIRENKGTDLLVDAMLRLMPERPDLRCLIVGREDEPAFAADLRARVEAAGLSPRFSWIPFLSWEALAAHYAALDLYVAPQRWEGFGLTPLEAMASGVPVVATRVGAFPDIVAPRAGTLVDPGDAALIAEACASWLDDAEARDGAGRAARAHVEAHHSIEAEAAALEEVYRGLLAGRGPGGAPV